MLPVPPLTVRSCVQYKLGPSIKYVRVVLPPSLPPSLPLSALGRVLQAGAGNFGCSLLALGRSPKMWESESIGNRFRINSLK